MKRDDLPFQRHWLYYVRAEIRGDRGCGRGRPLHGLSALFRLRQDQKHMARETFLGMRTHHIAIALIAILVAVALAANYYLW